MRKLIDDWLYKATMVALSASTIAARAEYVEFVAGTVLQCCDIIFVRMIVNISKLLKAMQSSRHFAKELNCWTAAITKKHRNIYERTYPTVVVLPDGSSINMQYKEPRKIVALPLDMSTLSEAERKIRLVRRKPKTKVKILQEIDDNFDESRYVKFLKKR